MVKTRKLCAMTEIAIKGHILNPLWRSRVDRRRVRGDVIVKVIDKYFKRYLPAAKAVPLMTPVKNDAAEKIYTLWLQGEDNAPPLIKSCANSVRKHCSQELIFLDEKTLFDHIDLPGVIMDKRREGNIAHAHFADIARVELLHNHGGFWLDATGFVTDKIPDQIINEDFFVYLAGNSVGSPYSFIQNCFIRGRRGAYLLEAWRAMILDYWMHEEKNFDYFMHQLLFKTLVLHDPRAKEFFAKMPHIDQDPTHALWWSYGSKPFDQKTFDAVTADSFFQKTTYSSAWAKKPPVDSFADQMINKMYKDN